MLISFVFSLRRVTEFCLKNAVKLQGLPALVRDIFLTDQDLNWSMAVLSAACRSCRWRTFSVPVRPCGMFVRPCDMFITIIVFETFSCCCGMNAVHLFKGCGGNSVLLEYSYLFL